MLPKAWAKFLAFLPAIQLFGTAKAAEKGPALFVSGWPLELKEAQKAILSNDAIMGTLVCPSLTRLNLLSRRSEANLLEKVEDSDKQWRLTLRPDLFWWDRSPVTLSDLETWVKETLPPEVTRQGMGQWTLPAFSVSSRERTLTVQWQQKPKFGPYIFNHQPLVKKAAGPLGIQCAGSWIAEGGSTGILLRDRNARFGGDILLTEDAVGPRPAGTSLLAFRFGEELQAASPQRQLDEELVCKRPIDTPILSVIAWNPEGAATKDPKFRKALTHLTPRGALLRAGAGYLGDLVSGPILRVHPGYKRSLLVPAYDPSRAESILNDLGYHRSEDDGFRRDAQGKPLEIKILAREHDGSSLLRKVLDDSFRALGIKLEFIVEGSGMPDGFMTGIMTSWPDSDLSRILHSRTTGTIWPWRYLDPALDQALDNYTLSLTRQNPDFTLLEKVHDLVYKLEPFSVLMQHRVCLEAQLMDKRKGVGEVVVRNPDWFQQLIGL